MELIKSAARKTRVSEVVYVILNVIYAAILLLLLIEFEGQPYLAYAVVLLSKWRVFAVRPRFWLANMQTNLLDTIVGLGVVTLLWQNMGNITYQLIVTGLFIAWLVFLKPRSKRHWVIVQGGVAQFVALSALFSIAYMMNVILVTALAWGIGYIVAHHVINIYGEEYEDTFISLVWGLVTAELSWIAYYWTIAYTAYRIPQIAIVMSLLGYGALVVYNYLYHNEGTKNAWASVGMPVAFSLIGIALVLVFFNGFDPTSI